MDKFNMSKMGIHEKFIPIVDRNLKVIANDAILVLEGNNPNQSTLQFNAHELRELDAAIDLYFKKLAIKSYKGNVPLILPTISGVNDPLPNSLPKPKGYELILTVNQPELWFNWYGRVMDHYDQLSARGVEFALIQFGQSFLSIPFLMDLRPKYIKLAWELIDYCTDDVKLHALIKLVQPYKDLGIQFVAGGIDSDEKFERFKPLADAFQGTWITESVSS